MMANLVVPKGWNSFETSHDVHVIPVAELDEHDDEWSCACQPDLTNPRPDTKAERPIWFHRRRREALQ